MITTHFRLALRRLVRADLPAPDLSDAEFNDEVERNYRWNFAFNLLDVASFWIGASFISSSTIVPLYVSKLTPSALAIGLVGFLSSLGKGPAELCVLLVISFFFLFANASVAGLATVIGERLGLGQGSRCKVTLYGGLVLELTYLFPIVGWLLVFPVVTIAGGGTTVRSLWRLWRAGAEAKRQKSPSAEAKSAEIQSV